MSEMHNNGQEQEIATIYCVNCGCGLNEEEGVLASPDWYEDTRFVHYCRDCQQKQFEDFAEDTSPAFAYFLSVVFPLPGDCHGGREWRGNRHGKRSGNHSMHFEGEP